MRTYIGVNIFFLMLMAVNDLNIPSLRLFGGNLGWVDRIVQHNRVGWGNEPETYFS
jgi:hypothetical protein